MWRGATIESAVARVWVGWSLVETERGGRRIGMDHDCFLSLPSVAPPDA
jgi:hypothetical protein